VVFLLVWFFWAAGQDLDLLVRHQLKTNFYIFQLNGLTALFFLIVVVVFCLNTAKRLVVSLAVYLFLWLCETFPV